MLVWYTFEPIIKIKNIGKMKHFTYNVHFIDLKIDTKIKDQANSKISSHPLAQGIYKVNYEFSSQKHFIQQISKTFRYYTPLSLFGRFQLFIFYSIQNLK